MNCHEADCIHDEFEESCKFGLHWHDSPSHGIVETKVTAIITLNEYESKIHC